MPWQVLYTWSHVDVNADGTDGSPTPVQVSGSNQYVLTQADVGHRIMVQVSYSELQPDGEFNLAVQNGGIDVFGRPHGTTTADQIAATPVVRNAQYDGEAYFGFTTGTGDVTATVYAIDRDELGTLQYEWQQSASGSGAWMPADGTGADAPTLTFDSASSKGEHYRLVVTWTDQQGVEERVASDPIRFAEASLVLPQSNLPELSVDTGVVVGGALRVNLPRETDSDIDYRVQWQQGVDVPGTGSGAEYWMDIPGATDDTFAVTSEYGGGYVRAVVTRTDEGGATDIRALTPNANGLIPAAANNAPTAEYPDGYVIESPGVTGDSEDGNVRTDVKTFTNVASSATPTTQVTTVTVDKVPLDDLFEDLDGNTLAYTLSSGPGGAEPSGTSNTVWFTEIGSIGTVGMYFDAGTGKLVLVTDERHGHDGDPTDGMGNVVNVQVAASDGEATPVTTTVGVRLNVAPTDILFGASAIPVGSGVDTVTAGENQDGLLIAHLNVLDENSVTHEFGTHEFTVSGDERDRFIITNTGNGEKDEGSDGSTWELRLKPGATLDFETDGKDLDATANADGDTNSDNLTNDKQIKLTLTATDNGGLSTPSGKGIDPITLIVTIINDPTDDAAAPLPDTDVPGLEDSNESDNTDERRDDEGGTGDGDTDGGDYEPPTDDMMMSTLALDDGLF